jgi:hypothetical protein
VNGEGHVAVLDAQGQRKQRGERLRTQGTRGRPLVGPEAAEEVL